MDIETRIDLIKEVGEEIITEEDLRQLLETKKQPIAYDGFEPSGTDIHIAQGLLRAININKMVKAGCKFTMWVADWHAWANNKMGGDLDKIQNVGKYLIEVWKACGMETDKVEFLWASEFAKDVNYWKTVMQVARNSTVKRIVRCSQIMGRAENEALSGAQIMYPCMQAADIFHLKADIAQLGMDQRKVNMLARELGPKLGYWKPVAVHHHMLMGLGQPPAEALGAVERANAMKMSKSNPDSAIFMTDTAEQIKKKIGKAYCPEGQLEDNPLIEYCKHLIFEMSSSFEITRQKKFGGDVSFSDFENFAKAFAAKEIHPMDLKNAVAGALDALVKPVREHFEKNSAAKKLREEIKQYKITR